jgi:hypothetical protein
LLAFTSAVAASPVMPVVRSAGPGAELLRNGGFERSEGGQPTSWQAGPQGFRLGLTEGRGNSAALVCENRAGPGWYGASQTLVLDQSSVVPLVVRGWSKAEKVSGSTDSGYSLYADLVYADGTPLWGQTANFHCGTHDWEHREVVILPEKPVRALTLHCLFRGHAGQAWFDDVSVEELRTAAGFARFQGATVLLPPSGALPSAGGATYATQDGLKLSWRDNAVVSLQVDGQELAVGSPSGFLVRDVAAASDVYGFQGGACPELQLTLRVELKGQPDHLAVEGRVADTAGRDRALTLLFALPVEAAGWHWGEDIRRRRRIQAGQDYGRDVVVGCGATGTLSLYPLAPIFNDRHGLAIALDMGWPAHYRLGYHAGTRQLFIAYDFGLVPATKRFPGAAGFRFVIFRFDPRWGFRAAWQRFMRVFSDYFVVRVKDQGIWMPFTDISTVARWEDFGFKFHEGNNNVAFDDAHQVLSFRYTEPMTWWMPMPKECPRTLAEALRIREQCAAEANPARRRMARAALSAAMFDDTSQPALQFRDEPWCNGAVWSLNPNPHLPGELNGATVHWDEAIQRDLYGPGAPAVLDGEYLDSLEGYVTTDLNFRREHFLHTTVPLTFSRDTLQPALFKGLAVAEFVKWIAADAHRLGKLTFANGVPYRFTFLCPWLDVMGTETDWLQQGQYRPASDAQMSLWRTLAGSKPYLLLLNTDYDAFTPERVERYFQRSLFYGMFPSMFSHNAADNPYWRDPRWYERDRALFQKYIPLIKRIAEAGWQPVTAATSDNERLFLERFGPAGSGPVYLTVFNDTAEAQAGMVRVDPALARSGKLTAHELVSDTALQPAGSGWQVQLQPQSAQLIELRNGQWGRAPSTDK